MPDFEIRTNGTIISVLVDTDSYPDSRFLYFDMGIDIGPGFTYLWYESVFGNRSGFPYHKMAYLYLDELL